MFIARATATLLSVLSTLLEVLGCVVQVSLSGRLSKALPEYCRGCACFQHCLAAAIAQQLVTVAGSVRDVA